MYFRIMHILFILLLPPFSAQVGPESVIVTTESEYVTDSRINVTETLLSSFSSPQPDQVHLETEEEDWTPAEMFLLSGDPTVLELGECTRAYSLNEQMGTLPLDFYTLLGPAMDALVNAANFLNMIFQASDLRESSVREDMEWYHALVRSLLEADPNIRRALLTFDADPASTVPQLLLRASRSSTPKVQLILLQDLSNAWESLHPPAPAPDDSWFTSFKFPSNNQPSVAALSKRVLLNDLNTLDTPKWGQGDSYITNRTGVHWGDVPYLECEDGHFLPGWLVTLSTSFYGLKPDLTPEFRGVIRVDVNVQDFDVDQCATGDGWFANTHQCNRTTMKCEPIPGKGFQMGQYCCRCKDGYYSPRTDNQDTLDETVKGSNSSGSDRGASSTMCYPILPICLPCWPGCRHCEDGAPCWVQEDWFLRAVVLAVQGLFMLLVFISMLVAYQFRRSRRIRASGLLLLETILFGSLLLYFPVFILYFKPSIFRCILLRWVRMLGFTIVYGTVTLKIYRVLKVFLSRTAQRVPYMSSTNLLRMLGIMVMTVSWFLCAWTVGVLQNRDRNVPLLITSTTIEGQGFSVCDLDRWDYMMAVAELLFLCWGSFLCSAVKPVPSAFHEPRYMGIAIYNELLLSFTFHLLRFFLPSLHPDWVLLLFFTHTHVTITVTLALLFIPKFIHVSRPGREEIAAEVYEDEVDLRRSGSYLNSSFTSTWSDHSLDPDDIRDELKKLYAQLEVHKTKKMTTNNPHLQKKRSSRHGLGRSIIKRITEIPESLSRQCSREDKEKPFISKGLSHTESVNCKRMFETIRVNSKDESVWQPSPVLHKSQSEHNYVRDKDHSLHDSIMRVNLAKRASQRSETDSLDTAPLVYKSASAHNLTVDSNLLHPDHNKLQKSLSLTSSKAHSLEETFREGTNILNLQIRSKQDVTIKDQATSALQSLSFDKAEICPWELEEQRPADKSRKHVTYALSHSTESKSPDSLSSPLAQHICPWDHLPPPPLALENTGEPCKNSDDRECDYPGPHIPILHSTSGSLISDQEKTTKEQRVFSFRTSTQKWLSVRAFIGSVDGSLKEKNRKDEKVKDRTEESISLKGQDSAGQNPCSNPIVERKTHQKRSITVDTKPCLVKQAAIRLSSSDSSERSPRRIVIVKSGVHPWDSEDMQKDGMYENVFVSRQNSTHSTHSTNEMSRKARTPLVHRVCGNRIMPTIGVPFKDVCPLDVPGPIHKSPQSTQSTKTDICPWEVEEAQLSERASVCPWESQKEEVLKRHGSVHDDVCPWESMPTNISFCQLSHQKSQLLNQRAKTICPREISKTNTSERSKTTISLQSDSPTDQVHIFPETNEPERPNKSPIDTSLWEPGNTDNPGTKETTKASIREEKAKSKETETQSSMEVPLKKEQKPGKQDSVQVHVCPWETDVLEKMEEKQSVRVELCHIESGNVQTEDSLIQSNTCYLETHITKADTSIKRQESKICPWETAETLKTVGRDGVLTDIFNKPDNTKRQSSTCVEVCPWETMEPEMRPIGVCQKTNREDSSRADVCPWETEAPEKRERPNSIHQDVCPWETEKTEIKRQDSIREDVCPWETEKRETKRQDSIRVNVCPWETEKPETKRQDSIQVDVCPWETEKPETKRQDSIREDVCPWETEKPETKRQDSIQVDVCPWETEKPETKRQDSIREDVCPWETQKPDTKRQDSIREDVCPWETEKAETKRQDSIREDVCPWETEKIETERQDSIREDVCPWETEKTETKRQDSIREDVCPWETEKPETKRQDSIREDVCPWETEKTETKRQGSIQVDVCPWETEKTETKRQGSIQVDVCPWETEKTETKRQDSIQVDVCPWETENLDTAKFQDSGRECICPWENAERMTEYNSIVNSFHEETTKAKTIKRQESIYTEPGTNNTNVPIQAEHLKQDICKVHVCSSKIEEPSGFTDDVIQIQPASSSDEIDNGQLSGRIQQVVEAKANMPLARRDALCPWEMEETEPSSISEQDCGSDVFTWEPEDMQDDEEDDAECAAEAFVFPDDL